MGAFRSVPQIYAVLRRFMNPLAPPRNEGDGMIPAIPGRSGRPTFRFLDIRYCPGAHTTGEMPVTPRVRPVPYNASGLCRARLGGPRRVRRHSHLRFRFAAAIGSVPSTGPGAQRVPVPISTRQRCRRSDRPSSFLLAQSGLDGPPPSTAKASEISCSWVCSS
jgi:hypothetical protein